jgi:hypothetical protein
MSRYPYLVTKVQVVPWSNDWSSSSISSGYSKSVTRIFASSSVNAVASRPRLSRVRAGVTSTSRVTYGDPRYRERGGVLRPRASSQAGMGSLQTSRAALRSRCSMKRTRVIRSLKRSFVDIRRCSSIIVAFESSSADMKKERSRPQPRMTLRRVSRLGCTSSRSHRAIAAWDFPTRAPRSAWVNPARFRASFIRVPLTMK